MQSALTVPAKMGDAVDRAFIQILARFEGACVSFETRGTVRRSDQAFGRFTRIRLQLKRNVKQARFESCVGEARPRYRLQRAPEPLPLSFVGLPDP